MAVDEFKMFVTGSYAYGTPKKKSDLDIVVLANNKFWSQIAILCEERGKNPGADYPESSVYLGGLNLIRCQNEDQYNLWKQGTEELIEIAPVTRKEAVAHFKLLREESK